MFCKATASVRLPVDQIAKLLVLLAIKLANIENNPRNNKSLDYGRGIFVLVKKSNRNPEIWIAVAHYVSRVKRFSFPSVVQFPRLLHGKVYFH